MSWHDVELARLDDTDRLREILLETQELCPAYPAIAVIGVALDADNAPRLIVSAGQCQVYVGPDPASVARQALVIVLALMRDPEPLRPESAGDVIDWLQSKWASFNRGVEGLIARAAFDCGCVTEPPTAPCGAGGPTTAPGSLSHL